MVSPAPNLTVLSGTVLARRPHPSLPDWDEVSLAVDATAAVPGTADLVSRHVEAQAAAVPSGVVVAVRRDLLQGAGPGSRITLRAKLTPSGPMAEQHPPPGALRIEPPAGAQDRQAPGHEAPD